MSTKLATQVEILEMKDEKWIFYSRENKNSSRITQFHSRQQVRSL